MKRTNLDRSPKIQKKNRSDGNDLTNSEIPNDRTNFTKTRYDKDTRDSKQSSNEKVIWGKSEDDESKKDPNMEDETVVKVKPNFGLTGALAKDEFTGNCINGVVLKYSIPLDSAKPTQMWRLYVFKDDKVMETFHIHRQASYLAGRDRRVADIILEHPSCSSQHAVFQYRKVKVQIDDDDAEESEVEVVKPFLMDLSSTHKTMLNGKQIDDCRYYELREKDVIRFGGSSREYVILHASSNDQDM